MSSSFNPHHSNISHFQLWTTFNPSLTRTGALSPSTSGGSNSTGRRGGKKREGTAPLPPRQPTMTRAPPRDPMQPQTGSSSPIHLVHRKKRIATTTSRCRLDVSSSRNTASPISLSRRTRPMPSKPSSSCKLPLPRKSGLSSTINPVQQTSRVASDQKRVRNQAQARYLLTRPDLIQRYAMRSSFPHTMCIYEGNHFGDDEEESFTSLQRKIHVCAWTGLPLEDRFLQHRPVYPGACILPDNTFDENTEES